MSNMLGWTTPQGNRYDYHVHPIGTTFIDQPGNYVFAKQNAQGQFHAVYIGETDSLKNRLADHEKQPCAVRNGATHILARVNTGGVTTRRKEQDELIAMLQPACNVQGK